MSLIIVPAAASETEQFIPARSRILQDLKGRESVALVQALEAEHFAVRNIARSQLGNAQSRTDPRRLPLGLRVLYQLLELLLKHIATFRHLNGLAPYQGAQTKHKR